MIRTLLLLSGTFWILPFSAALVNCRLACRHCRERKAHPDMLEVYCAMCDECKERRREWLQGPPELNLRNENDENNFKNSEQQEYQDDCTTTPTDDECQEPALLSQKVTTTTTTTTTTHRPSTPKPSCVKTTTTKLPCPIMPCPVMAIPMAMPLCPMCPMLGPMSTVPIESSGIVPLANKIIETTTSPTSESIYLYVGVPKKLLNDLKILRS